MLKLATIAIALLSCAAHASAEMVEKTGRFGGMPVTYKVVLPAGYDPARSYPVVLAFTGGAQQLRGAENTLNADWRAEAEKRGYIVISPGSPDGSVFFQEGEGAVRIFPQFLDMIVNDYKVPLGKLHIAGHSNGGITAYYVAAKYPKYFATVIGYPGALNGEPDDPRMAALKPLCLFMHVGDQDSDWMTAMQRQADSLLERGYKIKYTVEKNQPHRLRAQELNLSPRLFDEIESCK